MFLIRIPHGMCYAEAKEKMLVYTAINCFEFLMSSAVAGIARSHGRTWMFLVSGISMLSCVCSLVNEKGFACRRNHCYAASRATYPVLDHCRDANESIARNHAIRDVQADF